MKHLQLYESFHDLPEGVSEITWKIYSEWRDALKPFSPMDIETIKYLSTLANGENSVGNGAFSIVKGDNGVAFIRNINNYAMMTGIIPEANGFRYYSSISLDKLLPLAIDALMVKVNLIKIK